MAILRKQDERLASLPFPLKNVTQVQSADPTEMLDSDLIGKGRSNNKTSVIRPSSEFALGSVGQIRMLATRTTPCISIAEDAQYITLAMLYAGDRYKYRKEKSIQHIEIWSSRHDPWNLLWLPQLRVLDIFTRCEEYIAKHFQMKKYVMIICLFFMY